MLIDRRRALQLGLAAISTPTYAFAAADDAALIEQIRAQNTHLNFKRTGGGSFSILHQQGQFNVESIGLKNQETRRWRDPQSHDCYPGEGTYYESQCEFEEEVEATFMSNISARTPANDGDVLYAGWLNHVRDSLAVWTGQDCDGISYSSEAAATYVASNEVDILNNQETSIAFYAAAGAPIYEGDVPDYTVRLVDQAGKVVFAEQVGRRNSYFLELTRQFPDFRSRRCRAEIVVTMHQIKNGVSTKGAVASGKFSHGFLFEYKQICDNP